MAAGPIPTTDADFNTYVNKVNTHLTNAANKARLVITVAAQNNLTAFTGLVTNATTGWNFVYAQTQNEATDTTAMGDLKKTLRKQMEKLLRDIYADIPESVFTQTDRNTLNLPKRASTSSPVPVPQTEPTVKVVDRSHLSVTLNITDPEHPHTQAKPEGVDTIELESAFLPADATDEQEANFPKEDDFRHLASTGKFLYKRIYEMDQLAGKEFVRARYVNSRKEAGPWSEIVSVVVS